MATIVEMPRLSDTMTEGTVAGWLKQLGETVDAGDGFADIETDKATMTFESFDEGVLLATLIREGDTVPLGTPIAVLGEAGEDISTLLAELEPKVKAALEGGGDEAPAAAPEPESAAAPAPEPEPEPEPELAMAPAPSGTLSAGTGSSERLDLTAPVDDDGVRIKASPLARRLAAEQGIDLRTVPGTGPGGRIVTRDLEGLDRTRRVRPASGGAAIVSREDTVARATQMRRTIAKRLVEATQTAPHFYLTISVDAEPLVSFRAQVNAAQTDVKVSYNDLVMRACVVALQDHPQINASWEGKTIRQFGGVHLGFAVALEGGLITPVVRDADQKSLTDVALEVRDLAGRAREGTLASAEYSGNTFTVSNLGMFGIEHFTAIINPPASCILAVGALRDAPVVRDGELVAGKTMSMTLSCDHRVVDGAMGAAFLQTLKRVLETPIGLVL